MRAAPAPRAERLREIERLRAQGLTQTQIAQALGMTRSGVSNILNDPDGSKQFARRKRYQGTCEVCGKPTTGSEGKAAAPKLCNEHARAKQHQERHWTPERIIEQIQRFERENGRPPLSQEWLIGHHGLDVDGYPYTQVVCREFGTWANAIEAAGYPRPKIGWKPRDSYPGYRKHRVTTETLIQRIREQSVDGIAPSSADEDIRNVWWLLRRRGIDWTQACELAGVKPRQGTRTQPKVRALYTSEEN